MIESFLDIESKKSKLILKKYNYKRVKRLGFFDPFLIGMFGLKKS